MSGDIATHAQRDRRASLIAEHFGLDALGQDLGTPSDWLDTAVDHLRDAAAGHDDGAATVSAAALQLALMRLDELERAGIKIGGAP